MECSVCQDLQDLGHYYQVSHIIQGFGGQWYPGLVCQECKKCVAISYEMDPPQWIWVDDILSGPDLDLQGWQQARNLDDLWRHRILSGIVYNTNAPPKDEDHECQFGFPDLNVDQIHLLWIDGQARGFCSLRKNGTALGTPMNTYQMTILDTIFIDPRVRGRGHASCQLRGLLADNHLGLSTPISNDMLVTCLKALRKSPPFRERLWLVDNFGGAGERKNLWWSAVKLAKSRQLNLETIFK
ncbi:hypothetical protein TCAL_08735 [Tigriopus californicus]|uniref:N-acetyltransferase domain-containing protein n=1 Tax=Tigriopus californicus TaxID=6832 RepID=A0A553P5L8_TIGCA|nr:protein FAM169B-like isoform X2 [Tigriopus californicus]TRY72986.1 hypothetical protein TCAL_08735 [Tigriopus californicus]|eukprot:TCALIF_08735-PA protein Name:"Similar to Fam169b Protein FAM169B (Mus musculus)" AED:0.26 eAED:0.31 QI:0/0/0/1/1/1/2/0/240